MANEFVCGRAWSSARWFSGLGEVQLEFGGPVDIRAVGRLIGDRVLS